MYPSVGYYTNAIISSHNTQFEAIISYCNTLSKATVLCCETLSNSQKYSIKSHKILRSRFACPLQIQRRLEHAKAYFVIFLTTMALISFIADKNPILQNNCTARNKNHCILCFTNILHIEKSNFI
jgi:hypothetical protein